MDECVASLPPTEDPLNVADVLARMMVRLQKLTATPLTQDALVEITSIYNNVAYIFLYLEANTEHADSSAILPWKSAFHEDDALDEKLLRLLEQLECSDPEAEDSRRRFIRQLREKHDVADREHASVIASCQNDLKASLESLTEKQEMFLRSLEVHTTAAAVSTQFYRLLSETSDPKLRRSLSDAWSKKCRPATQAVIADLDRLVRCRREHAKAKGFGSALEMTLQRCRVSHQDVKECLVRYLLRSLDAHRALVDEVSGATGEADPRLRHFGHYLKRATHGQPPALFNLEAVLDFAFAVAGSLFGVRFRPVSGNHDSVVCFTVSRGDEHLGHIYFDLWDSRKKIVPANHMLGMRNRTSWMTHVQLPVAYVCCRFKNRTTSGHRITFQNVHSIFHEFGHALNHVLMKKRISNSSGLEYLPLERLECMSMWFEKWVYHRDFGEHLGFDDTEREGLDQCRRLKVLEYRRTFVERAVTAMLDFELHANKGLLFDEIFRSLDEEFGITEYCELDNFPPYFAWPNALANPGANFSYLLGAADSCERFMPYTSVSARSLGNGELGYELFASSLDFDHPSKLPDMDAVFEFYGSPVHRKPGTRLDKVTCAPQF